jgi:hypothetical protein
MEIWYLLGRVVHACNLSTQEAKAWGVQVWGQPGLHSWVPVSKNKLKQQLKTQTHAILQLKVVTITFWIKSKLRLGNKQMTDPILL